MELPIFTRLQSLIFCVCVKVQKGLLVLLIFSQIDFLVGSFLPRSDEVYAKGFTGWDLQTATVNAQVIPQFSLYI